jgi:small multidrug resistance pump
MRCMHFNRFGLPCPWQVVGSRVCVLYGLCVSVFHSMVGFNISLAQLDVSVAYAVWSALGTTLVTAVGFCFFGESLDMAKILYLAMIICGVIGLNLRG